jgi:hypothetical protein
MWKSKTERYEGQDQKFNYSCAYGFLISIQFMGNPK